MTNLKQPLGRKSISQAANGYPPSEANAVVGNFQLLSPTDKQAILDFLRSL